MSSYSDLDASGKPPSGLLAGGLIGFLGSYSECTKMIDGAHYCLNRIHLSANVSALLSKIEVSSLNCLVILT